MEITYEYGKIIVDKYNYNARSLASVLEEIFNLVDVHRDNFFTPSEIIFHRCAFKDTTFTLFETDFITLHNVNLLYNFGQAFEKFKGLYPLNITVKFEYCDYFTCSWHPENFPELIKIYNEKDHELVAKLSLFIEYNKVVDNIQTDYPSYPVNQNYGYKLLCERVSSHVRNYYLCKLSIPNRAMAIKTIAGEIRSNIVKVEKIMDIASINFYNYSPEVITLGQFNDIERPIYHDPFSGSYKDIVVYMKGEELQSNGIEMNSYRSFGKGLYMFSNVNDAINYMYRVINGDRLVVDLENGRMTMLPELLKLELELIIQERGFGVI